MPNDQMKQSPNLNVAIEKYQEKEYQIKQAGSFKGKHCTEYVELAKQLKREKKHGKAIELHIILITGS